MVVLDLESTYRAGMKPRLDKRSNLPRCSRYVFVTLYLKRFSGYVQKYLWTFSCLWLEILLRILANPWVDRYKYTVAIACKRISILLFLYWKAQSNTQYWKPGSGVDMFDLGGTADCSWDYCSLSYDRHWRHMMTSSNESIFRVTGHLCGEFTGPRWIPHTKTSYAELWCFRWSQPE